MAHAPVPVVHLPDIHPLLDPEYTPYDVGVMGELDVRILIELFGGREMADALAPAWNGGMYYAAQRKSAVTPAEKESTASLGLIYYSSWKNRDSARSFMHTYAAQIPRKYSNVAERTEGRGRRQGAGLLDQRGRCADLSLRGLVFLSAKASTLRSLASCGTPS